MNLRSVLGLAALFIATGCSHNGNSDTASNTPPADSSSAVKPPSSPGILGKWSMDPTAAKEDAPGQGAGFMQGFASTFWYEFKPDHTFQGSMSEGTYTLTGKHLEVMTTKAMGKETHATKAQMTGELSDDGTKLTLHPPQSDALKMLPTDLQDGIPMVK